MPSPPSRRGAEIAVALDARGADRGLEAVVEIVRAAAREGIRTRALGRPEELHGLQPSQGVEVVAAGEEIANEEGRLSAARRG